MEKVFSNSMFISVKIQTFLEDTILKMQDKILSCVWKIKILS